MLKQGLKSPQDNFYKVSPQQQYLSISNFIRFINPSLHIPSSVLWLLSLRISKMFVANRWMICQLLDFCLNPFPINIYLFKINNKISRRRSGMSSNLTLKTLETHHWRYFDIFNVNVEYIFIVEFEHAIVYVVDTKLG